MIYKPDVWFPLAADKHSQGPSKEYRMGMIISGETPGLRPTHSLTPLDLELRAKHGAFVFPNEYFHSGPFQFLFWPSN